MSKKDVSTLDGSVQMNIFNSWIRLKQTDQNILKIQGYESNLFMLCNFS